MINTENLKILKILKNAGIENAVQEANWIVKFAPPEKVNTIVSRRIAGEPLQYLLGEWEFYGYPFKVGKGVLIPRPETELLVDLAKEHRKTTVFDLCAGSGCVGIAVAKEVGCNVAAVEKSPEALKYLEKNIALNGVENQVEIIHGDVLDRELISQLSIVNCQLSIVINPPYLTKSEMRTLQKEVMHEPESALFGGGDDGLDFYRSFFRVWGSLAADAALFACEVGDGQAEAVCGLMEKIGLTPQIRKDFNNTDRVVYSTNI